MNKQERDARKMNLNIKHKSKNIKEKKNKKKNKKIYLKGETQH